MKTVLSVFVPLVTFPVLTFTSAVSFHCALSFTSPSFHNRSQHPVISRPAPFSLFGDRVINFFKWRGWEKWEYEKENMLRILWTVLRPKKKSHKWKGRWCWKLPTPAYCYILFQHGLHRPVQFPRRCWKFSPGCPYRQHVNKMAWSLEGVKGSMLEGGRDGASRSVGLLSLASV